MPRQGRIDFPGALHHVIIRGINRAKIFQDDRDRKEFTRRLEHGLNETKISCYAWALIPNHIHLLLQTGPHPLTGLMRSLLTGYALYFNRRYERVGYLFQNRFKSILCDKEAYLLQLVRYIHLNPLRAKLISSLPELNVYRWCGHSVMLGNQTAGWQDIVTILSHFGKTVREAREAYLDFVRKGVPEGQRKDLTGGGLLRSVGGWRGLSELKKAGDRWRGDERILGDNNFVQRALAEANEQLIRKEQRRTDGWSLNRLLRQVEKACGVKSYLIRGSKKDSASSMARALFAYWATNKLGFSLTETAEFLGVHKSTVLRAARKGCNFAEKQTFRFPSSHSKR